MKSVWIETIGTLGGERQEASFWLKIIFDLKWRYPCQCLGVSSHTKICMVIKVDIYVYLSISDIGVSLKGRQSDGQIDGKYEKKKILWQMRGVKDNVKHF